MLPGKVRDSFSLNSARAHPPRSIGSQNWDSVLVLFSMALSFGGVAFASRVQNPKIIGATAIFVILMFVLAWSRRQSPRFAWLLVFGITGGILELLTDWMHVYYFQSLVYKDYFFFRLLASPSYMPLGWAVLLFQFGYLALWLGETKSFWKAVAIVSILGMALPPWYEEFAAPAGAWQYAQSRWMVSHTPIWVIFAYGGSLFFATTQVLLLYRPGNYSRAVLAGVYTAAGIMLSGVLFFALLHR